MSSAARGLVSSARAVPGFVGRRAELEQLRRTLERPSASVAVVYGRRRIGKSALIRQSLAGREALYFEGLENRPKREQIRAFLLQLARQTGQQPPHSGIATWSEAFLLLEPVLTRRPATVVLDEFQWMANYRSAIVSDLKLVWEQYLSRIPGVHLILCGSIASFMTTRVVRSSALYGRTDTVIHLKEFLLDETRQMLPHCGTEDLMEAQMLLGGIPKYLELLSDYPSLHLAVDALAFTDNGYLVDEFDRIFVSHFGRNPDFRRLIGALAAHPYGLYRRELAACAQVDLGGGLTNHLADLESAGFIASATPFDRPARTKLIKYCLSDAYLRFYFAFVRPNLRRIRSGALHRPFSSLMESGPFQNWRGRSFEYVCAQHALRIAALLGFSGIDYAFGPYFRPARNGRPGVQIDLAYDRADNVLTLCEMKCSRRPIGEQIVRELAAKADLLRAHFPRRTVQAVLVVHGDVTEAVRRAPQLYRVIRSNELFAPGQMAGL